VGVLLIVLGLVSAGLLVDFLVENHLGSAPTESFALLGTTFRLSRPELVLVAAVLGALAVTLVLLGVGLLRGSWGRRRALKRRVTDLEKENTDLLSQQRLAAEVQPTRDAEASVEPATPPPPSTE
jgi:hypothetical protein